MARYGTGTSTANKLSCYNYSPFVTLIYSIILLLDKIMLHHLSNHLCFIWYCKSWMPSGPMFHQITSCTYYWNIWKNHVSIFEIMSILYWNVCDKFSQTMSRTIQSLYYTHDKKKLWHPKKFHLHQHSSLLHKISKIQEINILYYIVNVLYHHEPFKTKNTQH